MKLATFKLGKHRQWFAQNDTIRHTASVRVAEVMFWMNAEMRNPDHRRWATSRRWAKGVGR